MRLLNNKSKKYPNNLKNKLTNHQQMLNVLWKHATILYKKIKQKQTIIKQNCYHHKNKTNCKIVNRFAVNLRAVPANVPNLNAVLHIRRTQSPDMMMVPLRCAWTPLKVDAHVIPAAIFILPCTYRHN